MFVTSKWNNGSEKLHSADLSNNKPPEISVGVTVKTCSYLTAASLLSSSELLHF